MNKDLRKELSGLVEELEPTSRYIVLMYYLDELSPEEIGLVLDVTAQRVETVIAAFKASTRRCVAAEVG